MDEWMRYTASGLAFCTERPAELLSFVLAHSTQFVWCDIFQQCIRSFLQVLQEGRRLLSILQKHNDYQYSDIQKKRTKKNMMIIATIMIKEGSKIQQKQKSKRRKTNNHINLITSRCGQTPLHFWPSYLVHRDLPKNKRTTPWPLYQNRINKCAHLKFIDFLSLPLKKNKVHLQAVFSLACVFCT